MFVSPLAAGTARLPRRHCQALRPEWDLGDEPEHDVPAAVQECDDLGCR
jgi:hypothetical protein